MKPLISVIMPAYNAEKYIGDAIESILNQSFKDFEFIIINDASTDNTLNIIQEFKKLDNRIVVINNDFNLYIATTLNKGIATAKSDIIARMDADDISLPLRLEKQFEFLEKNNDVAIVGSDILLMDERGRVNGVRNYPTNSKTLKNSIFRFSPFAHPATMYRKNIISEFDGYNPKWSPSEDLDLWIKVSNKYPLANIPIPLFQYRVFSHSQSNKKLRKVELMTLQLRLNSILKYKYRPSVFDVFYNIMQFLTIWMMPVKFRYMMFNYLRNNLI